MDKPDLAVVLTINPASDSVEHQIWTPASRAEALGFSPRQFEVPVVDGTIYELSSADGRVRHEVYLPSGRLESILLNSKIFPVIRPVARVVVLEWAGGPDSIETQVQRAHEEEAQATRYRRGSQQAPEDR